MMTSGGEFGYPNLVPPCVFPENVVLYGQTKQSMKVAAKFNVNREKALFGEPDPPEVCEKVARSIPADILKNSKRILAVCIGHGGIARAIVNRMVNELYIDHHDAILRVYGVDLDRALVNRARRLGFVNTVCTDFLTWNPNMQFNIIVGNPPYQKGGNSAFYVQFFRKYAELLAPGGYFSIVAPSKAAAKYTKGYKELDKLGWNGVEYGMDSHFPNIGQPIAIYKGSDKGNEKPIIEVIDGDTVTNVARGSVLPVQYVSPSKKFQEAESELTLSIFQKFYGSTDKKVRERFETLDEPPTGPYVYLSTVAWGYHPARAKGGPYAFLTYVNDQDAYYATGSRGKFMRFKTQEQADQMHWLLSRSFAYRFIVAASCRAQFLPRVLLEETPDWHGVTTDEALFEKLGFTQAEINYINLWNQVTAGK